MTTKEYTYIYIDHRNHNKIVFVCFAPGICAADVKFKEATGKDVIKNAHIGCVCSNFSRVVG